MVLSTTTVDDNSNYPGFLFRAGSLSVFRNGGILTQGMDYTLVAEEFSDPVGGNDGDWLGMSPFFSSGSEILPGDTLRITKQIFEVYGDANIWMTNEIALVGQYPTVPEPAALVLAALGLFGWAAVRLRHHASLGWSNRSG